MNDLAAPRIIVPAIGTALAGGTCLGHVFITGEPFSLIVPPKAVREHAPIAWNKSVKRVAGALSYFDGLANTLAMAAAGSELAQWALELRVDGQGGFYIPARMEALVVRGNVPAVPAYANGGEAFEHDWYWTSTQFELNVGWAWLQGFGRFGGQFTGRKSNEYRAFVVRREPIR